MRNLELKDIKSYIDTDLICKCDKWEQPQVLTGARTNGILYFGEIGGACLCVDEVKPYLYSMDWLTKPITHKGEAFVPIVKLAKMIYPDCKIIGVETDRVVLQKSGEPIPVCIYAKQFETASYDIFDKLSEWHFDFRGLIDAGLAIPVTETFNPYQL